MGHSIYHHVLVLFQLVLFISCTQQVSVLARCDFSEVPTIEDPTESWVLLGSSTAASAGAGSSQTSVSGLLGDWLASREIKLFNIAVGGLVSYQILPVECVLPTGRSSYGQVLSANLNKATEKRPNVILISLPSNDVAVGFGEKEILNNFELINRYGNAMNTPIVLLGMQPRDFNTKEKARLQTKVNFKLKERFGNCYVDVYDQLSGVDGGLADEFNYDGVHINDKGHRILFDSIVEVVESEDCVSGS